MAKKTLKRNGNFYVNTEGHRGLKRFAIYSGGGIQENWTTIHF